MTYTNSLLQQMLYLTIELPVTIALSIIQRALGITTRYLSKRPLISWAHHIFFSVEARLAHLRHILTSFSHYTSHSINHIATFVRLTLITIIASAIRASQETRHAIKQANGKRTCFIISILPVFWAQQVIQQFNVDEHNQPIIDANTTEEIRSSIRQFCAFTVRLVLSAILLCIPLPYASQQQCSRTSLILRIITATTATSLLWAVLHYKKQIIDVYMAASTHFLLTIMLSVIAISVWIAPDKKAHRFLTITFGTGLFICWLAAPIIFALS